MQRTVSSWIHFVLYKQHELIDGGSGCDSVGRAVASDTGGPQFESRHLRIFKLKIYLLSILLYWKDEEMKIIRGREWPI